MSAVFVEILSFPAKSTKFATKAADKGAKPVKGHTGAVRSVAFSPDGQRIVTGSDDRTAKVWNALTGLEALALKPANPVGSVVFSPEGLWIATGIANASATNAVHWIKLGMDTKQVVARFEIKCSPKPRHRANYLASAFATLHHQLRTNEPLRNATPNISSTRTQEQTFHRF